MSGLQATNVRYLHHDMKLSRVKKLVLLVIVFSLTLHTLRMLFLNHDCGSQCALFNKQMEYDNATEWYDIVKASMTRKSGPVGLPSGNIQIAGSDYLKQAPFKFSPDFKNPCWLRNGILRCLPYVYVIGVKKCGTSNLFAQISLHPDFCHPFHKELQWFARLRFNTTRFHDSITSYVNLLHGAAKQIQNYSIVKDGRLSNQVHITGDGSPSNLHLNSHWKSLPGNENLTEPKVVILDYIKHFTPQAKIIVIFRDPIERLYSEYYHEYGMLLRSTAVSPLKFHNVVQKGVSLYKDCFRKRTIRSCVYEPSIYEQTKVSGNWTGGIQLNEGDIHNVTQPTVSSVITQIHIQLGIYYIFWEELLRVFPREQILVFQNKDMRNMTNFATTIYDFLDMRKLSDEEMYNVTNRESNYQRSKVFKNKGPMLNTTWNLLNQFYSPFNRKMAEVTGDATFLYNDRS